jgi:protein translocase SecG subunit
METLMTLLPYAQIALALLLIISIILQQRGSSLGGAFGDSSGATYYKRRGAEKFLFNITIVLSILFIASAVASFLLS